MYLLVTCPEKYFFRYKISTVEATTIMAGRSEATYMYETLVLSSCKISPYLHVWTRINLFTRVSHLFMSLRVQDLYASFFSYFRLLSQTGTNRLSFSNFWHQGVWWTYSVKRKDVLNDLQYQHWPAYYVITTSQLEFNLCLSIYKEEECKNRCFMLTRCGESCTF